MPFNPVQRLGELEIDILQRLVRAGTSELHLTGLEQSLLYLLAARAGQVVTRDEILDALWGVDYVSESNVVDRHVRNLRAKLQNDWRKPRFIATVPGKGYRFIPTFSEPGARPRRSVRPSTEGGLDGLQVLRITCRRLAMPRSAIGCSVDSSLPASDDRLRGRRAFLGPRVRRPRPSSPASSRS